LTARHPRDLRPGIFAYLAEADFASIGTNELAQHAFAADRLAGELASLLDPWQPALPRLVELVGRAGAELGNPIGVCAEAAGDPLLAPVLVGLGATSLSMARAAVVQLAPARAGGAGALSAPGAG
jgi:phosphotransferase system enzyme I (PtsI)